MLYPMEDRAYLQETGERRMLYACRNCSHKEVAEDLGIPVYRNVVTSTNRGKFLQMYDVWLDPTLRRTRSTQCSHCGNREAVYFMGPVGRNDTAIVLYFVYIYKSRKLLYLIKHHIALFDSLLVQ
ncbi:hypothetical protein Gasu2_50500 [Galdieria sulphuraria]|nr:hypothetical protein Gasu2_35740 [Galdieria sulphuraria]GJD10883.1 hypothetical protein Gasu2_50500 [Galdieria sulphuraria]